MPPPVRGYAGRWRGRWPVVVVALISAGLAGLTVLAPPLPEGSEDSRETEALLDEAERSKTGEKDVRAVSSPATDAVARSPASTSTPPAAQTLQQVLRPGDSSSDVRRLQAILKSLGYDIDVTGVFDETTRKAVLDFQGQQGLTKDGVVGPKTRQRLEAAALWHTVGRGETLWGLARTFGTTVELLMEVNDLADPAIRAGQRLLVPVGGYGSWSGDWTGYTVKPGDTLSTIAARFHVSLSEFARLNRIGDPNRLRVGERLQLPGDVLERIAQEGSSGAPRPVSVFPLSWPLPEKGRLSSGFGWRRNPFGGGSREFHGGIDIAVPQGTPVRAAAPGVVVEAGWMGTYGYGVVIDHGRGVQTLYGHNARVLVQPGERVERGQVIAISGSSGRSTGPHLDFRVRINGRLVDPLGYVPRP